MADGSSIEWTDATWNPVRGCTRISAGCGGPNRQGGCYAEQIAARFSGPGQPFEGFAKRTPHGGAWTGKLALVDDMLTLPLRWKKPRRIFVNSMSDLFHENLPDEAIDKVFAVMALAPQHTFQVLTKRAARMREYVVHVTSLRPRFTRWAAVGTDLARAAGKAREAPPKWPLPNVWLGVSTEDQATADERIPHLLATPAAKRFISAEPLLGAVDLLKWFDPTGACCGGEPELRCDNCPADAEWRYSGPCTAESLNEPTLDWIIAGGESGPRARPAHPDWFRALRDQCAAANVPFFFKQWGEWLPVGQHLPGYGKIHGASAVKPGRMKLHYAGTPKQAPKHAYAERGVDVWSIDPDASLVFRVGKKAAGAMLDGKLHREFPE